MKLKVLKPGKWGINQPGPEVIVLAEDKIGKVIEHDTIDMKTALEMEKTKYVKIVDDGTDVDESDPLDSLDEEEAGVDDEETHAEPDDEVSGDGLKDSEAIVAVPIRTILVEITGSATGKRKQKDALETWALANLNGFDLDKSKKVEECIDILVEEHEKQNG